MTSQQNSLADAEEDSKMKIIMYENHEELNMGQDSSKDDASKSQSKKGKKSLLKTKNSEEDQEHSSDEGISLCETLTSPSLSEEGLGDRSFQDGDSESEGNVTGCQDSAVDIDNSLDMGENSTSENSHGNKKGSCNDEEDDGNQTVKNNDCVNSSGIKCDNLCATDGTIECNNFICNNEMENSGESVIKDFHEKLVSFAKGIVGEIIKGAIQQTQHDMLSHTENTSASDKSHSSTDLKSVCEDVDSTDDSEKTTRSRIAENTSVVSLASQESNPVSQQKACSIQTLEETLPNAVESSNRGGFNLQTKPTTNEIKQTNTVDEKIISLQAELKESQAMVKKLQSLIVKEKAKSTHTISKLKIKIEQGEVKLKRQQELADQQLGEAVSHLLILEGKIKKENQNVHHLMQLKDTTINRQAMDIATLTETNQRLVTALQRFYQSPAGKNGLSLDPIETDSVEEEEPLSPSPKSPKHKGVFGFNLMKDKMKRHRSTLDLSEGESNIKQGLVRRRQYCSQENLMSIGRKKESRENRDKKSRTIGGFPDPSLAELIPEVPDENDSRLDSFATLSNSSDMEERLHSSDQHLHTRGRAYSGEYSMPVLNSTEDLSGTSQERPKSVTSVGSIENVSTNSSTKENKRSKSPTPSTSSHSESSNVFKNLKTILKRKGSKNKTKNKLSVKMADSPGKEYEQAMRKHFEKYDMS